jgi:hypothetical protein
MGSEKAFTLSLASVGIACIACSCSAVDEPSGNPSGSPAERRATSPPITSSAKVTPSSAPNGEVVSDDYPFPRPWSKNVPNQACANDNECGDGFCDRGQCAAIWNRGYGHKCDAATKCLCIDGRCRSCASDEECQKTFGAEFRCGPSGGSSPGRNCGPLAPKAGLPEPPLPRSTP